MTGFVRAIGIGRATAMVVGTIIGASIFVQPSLVSGAIPSMAGVLLVWTAAGALTIIGALVTAELSSAYPRTGGVYVFLREAYGAPVAYLWGWAMFWSMHSGIIAAIATVFARYVGQFVELGDAGTRVTAVAAIVGLSVVNYLGVRWGSAVQTGFTVIKVVAVVGIVALGAVYVARSGVVSPAGGGPVLPSTGAFVSAMVAGLFAYGGWHMVTYAAEETTRATSTIPRALIIGTLAVTAAYIAVNAAYLVVLPHERVTSSQRVAADFAAAVVGHSGAGAVVAVLVILSALGGLTGIILAGPRVYQAMANDGLLFPVAAKLHPRHGTPHVAIAMQAVWSSALVFTGTYRALFTRVVYTEWIFFALMAGSLFFLRSRPGYDPEYRVPAGRLLAGVFVVSSAGIVIHEMVANPRDSLIGLGIVAAGFPVFWFWTRRRRGRTPATLPSDPT